MTNPTFALLFLVISFVFGWMIVKLIFPSIFQQNFFKIFAGFLLGNFFLVWMVFLLTLFLPFEISILGGCILALAISFIIWSLTHSRLHFNITKKEVLLYIGFFIFSLWFMNKSFSSAPEGDLKIGVNAWADFEMHIPLIRSFSWGNNFPPTALFFPNQNFSYHFMFYLWSGILEFLGLHITGSLNLISALSLTTLLAFIYKFPQYLFKSRALTGFLAVAFFLFNGSFGFLDALNKLKARNFFDLLNTIWNNNQYLSVGPFQQDRVSIIWNLNVYANQRHIIFAFALGLLLLLYYYFLNQGGKDNKKMIFLGVILGLLPFWQIHVFMGLFLVFLILGFLNKDKSLFLTLLISIILAGPQVIWLNKDIQSNFAINPGFLAQRPLTLLSFSSYWFFNLGLSLVTIPLSFFLVNSNQRKWLLAIMPIFIVTNLFQFSVEMFNNHKLLNFWLLLVNFYTAFILTKLLTRRYWRFLVIPLVIIFTLSGIIDFMVTKNEKSYTVSDFPNNTYIKWVKEIAKPRAIFLGFQDDMYHPVRMAGRPTFLFSPRYAWGFGYNITERDNLVKIIYSAQDTILTKNLLVQNYISYIILPKILNSQLPFYINYPFFLSQYASVFSDNNIQILQVN